MTIKPALILVIGILSCTTLVCCSSSPVTSGSDEVPPVVQESSGPASTADSEAGPLTYAISGLRWPVVGRQLQEAMVATGYSCDIQARLTDPNGRVRTRSLVYQIRSTDAELAMKRADGRGEYAVSRQLDFQFREVVAAQLRETMENLLEFSSSPYPTHLVISVEPVEPGA